MAWRLKTAATILMPCPESEFLFAMHVEDHGFADRYGRWVDNVAAVSNRHA